MRALPSALRALRSHGSQPIGYRCNCAPVTLSRRVILTQNRKIASRLVEIALFN
jgi:hypothetical protein